MIQYQLRKEMQVFHLIWPDLILSYSTLRIHNRLVQENELWDHDVTVVANTKRSHLNNKWGPFANKREWITDGFLPAEQGVAKRTLKALQTLARPQESNLKVTYLGRLIWWTTLIVLHIPRPEYGLGYGSDTNSQLLSGQVKVHSKTLNVYCLKQTGKPCSTDLF